MVPRPRMLEMSPRRQGLGDISRMRKKAKIWPSYLEILGITENFKNFLEKREDFGRFMEYKNKAGIFRSKGVFS